MDSATQSKARDVFETRLTEHLLERGVVTRSELEEALEQQVILGGHLATNIWELGLAESKVLNALIGEILRLPVAVPEKVASSPPEIRVNIPSDLVEQTRMMPLRLVGRTLHVATCEPWDMGAAKQFSFATGKHLSMHFLGEVEFMRLADRVYGIEPSARFKLGRNPFRKKRIAGEDASLPAATFEDLMPEDDFESIYSDKHGVDPAVLARPAHEPEPEAIELDFVESPAGSSSDQAPNVRPSQPLDVNVVEEDRGDEVLDLVDEIEEEEAPQAPLDEGDELLAALEELGITFDLEIDEPQALGAALPVPTAPRPITSLAEAASAIESASGRDELGMVLLRFALGRGKRAVLLTRRGQVWFGWLGAGTGVDSSVVPGLMLPSEPGTAFGLVGQTGAPFLGPLLPHPVHDAFLARLGKARPGSVGLFPIHHRGKLVFGVYLDEGHERNVAPDVGELLVLAQKAALALQRLVSAKTGR